jgi:hypothetical protein
LSLTALSKAVFTAACRFCDESRLQPAQSAYLGLLHNRIGDTSSASIDPFLCETFRNSEASDFFSISALFQVFLGQAVLGSSLEVVLLDCQMLDPVLKSAKLRERSIMIMTYLREEPSRWGVRGVCCGQGRFVIFRDLIVSYGSGGTVRLFEPS